MKKLLTSLLVFTMITGYAFSQKRGTSGFKDGVSYAIDYYGDSDDPYWKIEFGNAPGKMRHVDVFINFSASGGHIKTEHYKFDLTDIGGYKGYSLGPLYVPKGYKYCTIMVEKMTVSIIK